MQISHVFSKKCTIMRKTKNWIFMENRLYNFSPGPAMLPEEVLKEIKENIFSLNGFGAGPMEFGHRTKEFMQLSEETTDLLKEILGIRDNYEVIMMHGGARTQFAAIPLNYGQNNYAEYYVNGLWSEKAFNEANLFINAHARKTMDDNFVWQTHSAPDNITPAYLHYTPNETVHGILIPPPETDTPLVADATSALLGMKLDVNKHDLIYAAAQKNMGIAGITFVIIKKDFLEKAKPITNTPSIMHYKNQVASMSLYNTPTTFAIYVSNLMFKWVKNFGGLQALIARNLSRSQRLYQTLTQYDCYECTVPENLRSPLNVCFKLKDESQNSVFLEKAMNNNLYALKGHRVVGGMRASIYNGMPDKGVDTLINFLSEYATERKYARKNTQQY